VHGTIRSIFPDRRYGFITGEDGRSYFVHASDIVAIPIADLIAGDAVAFDPDVKHPRGPRATSVRRGVSGC
jgi:CspA family cold shock protein